MTGLHGDPLTSAGFKTQTCVLSALIGMPGLALQTFRWFQIGLAGSLDNIFWRTLFPRARESLVAMLCLCWLPKPHDLTLFLGRKQEIQSIHVTADGCPGADRGLDAGGGQGNTVPCSKEGFVLL